MAVRLNLPSSTATSMGARSAFIPGREGCLKLEPAPFHERAPRINDGNFAESGEKVHGETADAPQSDRPWDGPFVDPGSLNAKRTHGGRPCPTMTSFYACLTTSARPKPNGASLPASTRRRANTDSIYARRIPSGTP